MTTIIDEIQERHDEADWTDDDTYKELGYVANNDRGILLGVLQEVQELPMTADQRRKFDAIINKTSP